jgi:hypothetical protein
MLFYPPTKTQATTKDTKYHEGLLLDDFLLQIPSGFRHILRSS